MPLSIATAHPHYTRGERSSLACCQVSPGSSSKLPHSTNPVDSLPGQLGGKVFVSEPQGMIQFLLRQRRFWPPHIVISSFQWLTKDDGSGCNFVLTGRPLSVAALIPSHFGVYLHVAACGSITPVMASMSYLPQRLVVGERQRLRPCHAKGT